MTQFKMSKSKLHIIVASFLFATIVFAYLIMALKFPVAYIIGTYEDFVGEWTQFFLFVAVFIIAFRLAFFKSRFRFFFIVLALASFYTFMEEISWGQRIFNITPPEFFMRHNLQRETNLHNFLTGPYSTKIKSFMEYMLASGLILYGLIYPIALKGNVPFAQWSLSKGLPSPPLYLWPYFVLSAVLELGILQFNEAEVAEILIPLALLIFMLHFFIANTNKALSDTGTSLDRAASGKLAFAICSTFVLIVILSTGTTYAGYSSPGLKVKMENKLSNGIEKFAGRYKKYEMWGNAIYLYNIIDERDPDRPSIQRNLAYCYGKTGSPEEEEDYIERAFDIDREKLEERPESISANLSIAFTYRQVGNSHKEQYHLGRAMELALQRVRSKPKSAGAAYWLGKVYEQYGNMSSAFTYYEKAFSMKPNKKKYRKAYMRSRGVLKDISDDKK